MKYILIAILVLGLAIPALAAEAKDVENYVTKNFTLKPDETALDAAIRLLGRLKEIRPERETVETSTVEKGEFGRTRQVYELRYLDTGELISKRIEVTEYATNGVIKAVTQDWYDAGNMLLKQRKISYAKGQPVVTNIAIESKPIIK